MRFFSIPLLAVIALASVAAFAAEPGAVTDSRNAPVAQSANLPNVLLIGDSIAGGYTKYVRALLAGKANVYRESKNEGNTTSGVAHVDEWIAQHPGHWAVIHFNFGLHDIKLAPRRSEPAYPGGYEAPPDQYEKNLRTIDARFKTTGASLIFATTTPVPDCRLDPPRTKGDEVKYNQIALKVMHDDGVAIDDLYNVALPLIDQIQLKQNVHYTQAGYEILAKSVAASIEAALAARQGN
ncbi:MAG: SGNH/GDSL hydrolase family protein [Capsulimonadaceae bacterium]|nr:SGNH/GDSL hydrolase family protein [Capsulimonadaceae bacterium]